MTRRHPVLRALLMLGAALQLLSPSVAAIADGLLASESAAEPLTHVEATTTAKCPVVHAPDCGMCRYLSGAATLSRLAPLAPRFAGSILSPCGTTVTPLSVVSAFPNGRAPPLA